MKKLIYIVVIVFVISACQSAPSEEIIQTAIGQTQVVQPSATLIQVQAPSSTPRPTEIPIPSGTPEPSPISDSSQLPWERFSDQDIGINFQYPAHMSISSETKKK